MPTVTMATKAKGPQCKVCNDEASGFHYGVDSCEGCKGFFRRCITQGMNHRCANEEKCEITPFSRNSCQFCRLKKCFTVGMSREASRLGRRPKRLKEALEQNHRASNHSIPPIVPCPPLNPQQLAQLSMAELQRLLAAVNQNAKVPKIFPMSLKTEPDVQEGCAGDIGNGATNGLANDMTNGLTNSVPNGLSRNLPTDLSTGISNGISETMPNDMSDRMPNGVSNTMPIGLPNGVSDILPNRLMNGMSNGLSNGYSDRDSGLSYEGHDPAPNSQGRLPRLDQLDIPELEEYNYQGAHLQASHHAPQVKHEISGGGNQHPHAVRNGYHKAHLVDPAAVNHHNHVGGALAEEQHELLQMLSISGTTVPEVKAEEGSPASCSKYPDMPDLHALLAEARVEPSGERRELVHQVIETVVTAHLQTCIYTDEKVRAGKVKFLEKMKNSPPMVDLSKMMPMLEGGNPNKMWDQFVKNMVPVITRVVKFCKRLPGFLELSQDDQIKLIKLGSFEVVIMRYIPLFEEDGMYIPSMDMKIPRFMVKNMPMGNFFEHQFNLASKLNSLHLNDSEVALYTAIMILNPERGDLENKKAVQKLLGLFLQAFYVKMKTIRSVANCEKTFMEALHLLPDLQEINKMHAKFINNMRLEVPDLSFPALHEEVYSAE